MIKHYIIMSSSYADGNRIALDITKESLLNSTEIHSIIKTIKKICGQDVPLSTHLLETDSDSWDSVKEYDPFFEDVEHIKSVEQFSETIKQGRVLSGLDVAKYILSKTKCTHLSLEKLVYFAYADYLCEYSQKLFEDHIYAFRHGPVIDSVYETYKRSGYDYIESMLFDQDKEDRDIRTGVKEMPAKSRILFAQDGVEKIKSIDKTLGKYGNFSAGFLVSLTHRSGSPWSKVDSGRAYQVIADDLIKKYHYVESVS